MNRPQTQSAIRTAPAHGAGAEVSRLEATHSALALRLSVRTGVEQRDCMRREWPRGPDVSFCLPCLHANNAVKRTHVKTCSVRSDSAAWLLQCLRVCYCSASRVHLHSCLRSSFLVLALPELLRCLLPRRHIVTTFENTLQSILRCTMHSAARLASPAPQHTSCTMQPRPYTAQNSNPTGGVRMQSHSIGYTATFTHHAEDTHHARSQHPRHAKLHARTLAPHAWLLV